MSSFGYILLPKGHEIIGTNPHTNLITATTDPVLLPKLAMRREEAHRLKSEDEWSKIGKDHERMIEERARRLGIDRSDIRIVDGDAFIDFAA